MDIEKIKLGGEITAIKEEIRQRIFRLQGSMFEGITTKGKFVRLCDSISEAESCLDEISKLYIELKSLEPDNI